MLSGNQLAFDLAASSYDEEFTHTVIGMMQRQRVHFFLKKTLRTKSLKILEINCGSGEDAVWFARQGNAVTATDASPKMIQVAKEKAGEMELQEKVQAKVCCFDDLRSNFKNEEFDLIFSDFGGLNCVSSEQLEKLSEDFAGLLKPHGRFIAVVMGRKCLWERFYFLRKKKPAEAYRRKSKELVEARINNSIVPTWYYSPKDFEEIFSDDFKTIKVMPVGLFIPPSYLNSFFEKRTSLLLLCNNLERSLSFSFLSNYADHFFIEMLKKN